MSSEFSNFYVLFFIFRIIFGRTCYGTTVITWRRDPISFEHVVFMVFVSLILSGGPSKQTLELPFRISHPKDQDRDQGGTSCQLQGTHSLATCRPFFPRTEPLPRGTPAYVSGQPTWPRPSTWHPLSLPPHFFHLCLSLSLPCLALRSWIDHSNHRYSASISTTIVSPHFHSLYLKIDPFLRFFGAEISQSEPIFTVANGWVQWLQYWCFCEGDGDLIRLWCGSFLGLCQFWWILYEWFKEEGKKGRMYGKGMVDVWVGDADYVGWREILKELRRKCWKWFRSWRVQRRHGKLGWWGSECVINVVGLKAKVV